MSKTASAGFATVSPKTSFVLGWMAADTTQWSPALQRFITDKNVAI
jgi:hypothetical protein